MPWSDEARVLSHPFAAYAEIAKRDARLEEPHVLRARLARLAVVVGTFVTLTAAGRMVPFHFLSPSLAFAWIPLVQLLVVALIARIFAREMRFCRVASLYLAGHGGWMVLLLVVAAGCIFAPDPAALARLAFGSGILPALILATFVSGVLSTYAWLRVGLGLSRGRSALGLLVFYVALTSIIAGFYLVTGQLAPLFWGRGPTT